MATTFESLQRAYENQLPDDDEMTWEEKQALKDEQDAYWDDWEEFYGKDTY